MQKPTFNPNNLLPAACVEKQENNRVSWQPDKTVIEALLQQQNVRLDLPMVFYSVKDEALQQLIPTNVQFIDELITSYTVQQLDENKIIITVNPKEAAPFYVTIEQGAVILNAANTISPLKKKHYLQK